MKRLLTALTVVLTMTTAMPALAAPRIISKKRLAIPALSRTIVQKYFSNITWKYRFPITGNPATNTGYGTIKNPPMISQVTLEKMCGTVEYRLWHVEADASAISKQLNKKVSVDQAFEEAPYILQATQRGRSYYAPWTGVPHRMNCFGERLRLMSITSDFSSIDLADVKSGKLKPAVSLSLEAQYHEPVVLEGIYQYPGIITRSVFGEVTGNSTIYVLEKDGRVTEHHPTWFRDYGTLSINDLKPSFLNVSGTLGIVEGTFYRLPDGYGVTEYYGFETYQPLDPICTEGVVCSDNEAPDYRIRNGEAQYSLVTPFKPTDYPRGNEIRVDHQTGIVFRQNAAFNARSLFSTELQQGAVNSLIHGAPPQTVPPVEPAPGTISLGRGPITLALDPEKMNGGSVVWETGDRALLRYYMTPYKGTVQYWETVIQK